MKFYSIILYALTLLCACGRTYKDHEGHPTVTVSIAPQAWLLEAIAGDSVNINILLGSGANPETYEPSINTIKTASQSDAMMLSGALGFESQLAERLKSNNPDLTVIDTSHGIEPIYGTHSHGNHTHSNDIPDPHTWTSVRNARTIAGNMLAALIEIDPVNKYYYQANAAVLDSRLDSLDRSIKSRLDSLQVKSFLVWHPSLSYFARDYGLEQISIGNEGREATIGGLRSTIDHAAGSGTCVLFIQADFDSRQAETISRETGADVVTINPLDHDWESQINIITDALDRH